MIHVTQKTRYGITTLWKRTKNDDYTLTNTSIRIGRNKIVNVNEVKSVNIVTRKFYFDNNVTEHKTKVSLIMNVPVIHYLTIYEAVDKAE